MWTFITALTPCISEHTLLSTLCVAIAWKEQQQLWKSVVIMLSNTFLTNKHQTQYWYRTKRGKAPK